MSPLYVPLLAKVSFALAASVTAGQGVPNSLPARQSWIEVSPTGAELRQVLGSAPRSPSSGAHSLTAPGLAWSHSDGGLAWIGIAASLGERGTQVFAEYDLNNEADELFSSFDTDPPTAVWSDGTALGSEARMVASADENDVHVSIRQVIVNGNPATRQAVVSKYSSTSPVPLWTYTFAPIINAGAKVGIARDGRTIAAALTNDSTWDVEIAVWGPANSLPGQYTKIPVGTNGYLRGFDLSADGSTLYFSAGTRAYIFDIATHAVVFDTDIGASFDSHAISGDGGVFAFGNFNALRVWERSGGTYINTHTATKPGQVYCARVDVSDDGSTVAAGWYYYNPGLQVTLEALDVPTKSTTMSETLLGVGGLQNLVADVVCSADGERFAVGLWGDAGTIDEVRLYDRDQNAPIATLNTPGSIFDVDLSADGQRVVGASKAVHANSLGNGGRIDLLDAGGEDFVLRGAPTSGGTIDWQLYGTVGQPAFLLTALALDPTPVTYPGGIGTLFIDRASLTVVSMGSVQAQGFAQLTNLLSSDPTMIGKSFFHQGMVLGPRRLSADWVKLTILP
jgi:WD40 repeat protein